MASAIKIQWKFSLGQKIVGFILLCEPFCLGGQWGLWGLRRKRNTTHNEFDMEKFTSTQKCPAVMKQDNQYWTTLIGRHAKSWI